MAHKLYILTGPSGVGKTTVANRLLDQVPNLTKLVTYTTREPRAEETNGVHYNFVDEPAFTKMIEQNELFEWAKVYEQYYGNTTKDLEELLKKKDVLMVIDVQGAKTVEEKRPEASSIFLTAESKDELMDRIKKRGKVKAEDLETRLVEYETEMAFAEKCDHQVMNAEGKIYETVEELKKIMAS